MARLGLGPSLLRTFKSTNPIESIISVARTVTGNVKRWRNGEMILRWTAAEVLETEKQFRLVYGYQHLQLLRAALGRTLPPPDVLATRGGLKRSCPGIFGPRRGRLCVDRSASRNP